MKLSVVLTDVALAIMILQSADKVSMLYVIGVICILAAKIALLWNDKATLSIKAVIVTAILSIAGGYLGYLFGLIVFPERELVRLIILLAFIYLGDTILIGLKTQFPQLYKSILRGGANAIIKKMGAEPEEKKDDEN